MGEDKNAKIYGGISISKEKKVIVYNLNIEGVWPNNEPVDGIDISGASTNAWIHHCTIWNAPDGNIDIKKQVNYVTVSYCKFYYTDKYHTHRLNKCFNIIRRRNTTKWLWIFNSYISSLLVGW